jgi:hypothetical protein
VARFVSVVWLLAIGCSGKDETTTPVVGDDDDETTTEDTADSGGRPGPAPKLTAEVRFRAFVAFDGALGTVVNPTDDGEDLLSVYLVQLYAEGWSDADETSYCTVYTELAGTPLSAAAPLEGFLWGIDIPAGLDGKVIFSDCLEKGFDAGQFVKGDPNVEWGAYDWQLRFGGELSADLADWLTPDPTTADFDLQQYAAGGWSTETAGLETEAESNYWYAYGMDAAHEIDYDTRLQNVLMTNGNGQPVTAYFIFDQRVYWTLTPDTTE